jgi:hypothetical protein
MPVAPASPKAPNVTGRQLGHDSRSGCPPGLCIRSQEVKPVAMAGDYGRFQRALLRSLTASFSVAELVSTGGVAGVHGEWYDRIGARLDALPIDGRLYVSRFSASAASGPLRLGRPAHACLASGRYRLASGECVAGAATIGLIPENESADHRNDP